MANQKYVKYTGKFQFLKKVDGWQFRKAFANNYRVYTWMTSDNAPRLDVWQHLGGYLEIDYVNQYSFLIVAAIQSGWLDTNVTIKDGLYWVVVDMQDNKLFHEKDPFYVKEQREKDWQVGCDKYDKVKSQEFQQRWRVFYLEEETVNKVKELLTNGWIEVCDDHRIS